MYLKTLQIAGKNGHIRKIQFRNGLNLIIDNTPVINGKETGNNVGKTTVLMLIDYCLGSSGKNIYTDPENKKEEYKAVKAFLVENEVVVSLTLSDDLDNDLASEVLIERNFLSQKKIIRRINGENLTDEEFEPHLTDIFFPGHEGKPTFRQLISHNIRYRDLSLDNTLKTLDKFTRDDEYETLYLYLLGYKFEHGNSKQALLSQLRIESTFKSRLEREQTRSAYETALQLLEAEIEKLTEEKNRLKINKNFDADFLELGTIKRQINVLASKINLLKIRRDLIVESAQEFQAARSAIDVQQLRQIYTQASSQIEKLHKTFEELEIFHNKMLEEKISYVTKELPDLISKIENDSAQLDVLLFKEKVCAAKISTSTSFDQLEQLISSLNDKHSKKGEYSTIIKQICEVETNIARLKDSLEKIDEELFSSEAEEAIKEKVGKFNKFFSAVSETLYGERYALKFDIEEKKKQKLYKFSAFNLNFSSGKKQGEISCFDIAYTLFADDEKIPCLHFLLNDKRELMHDNQLVKIADLVELENIQFVASILRDKLPPELNDEKYFAVELSQKDKLFRIERDQSAR